MTMKLPLRAVLALAIAAPVAANTAFDRLAGESAAAPPWVRSAISGALAGSPDDQLAVAAAYEAGRGLPQDYGAAVDWYTRSAAQGSASAMVGLGVLLENGSGVPADPARAVSLYRKAVAAGSAPGLIRLGMAFEWGRGVGRDACLAAAYYRQAMRNGEPFAELYLALLPQHAALDGCGK